MNVVIHSLLGHKLRIIRWDRSEEGTRTVANLTKYFIGLGRYVIE